MLTVIGLLLLNGEGKYPFFVSHMVQAVLLYPLIGFFNGSS